MILIDALYINNGGGKILLDYLIQNLEKRETVFCYLLDERIKNNFPVIKESNRVIFCNASLYNRWRFYKKNNFSSIFCFGNIPPLQKTSAKVFTYFHNPMYLEIPKGFSKIQRFVFFLKVWVIHFSKNNTNYWLVQSELIKSKLQEKFEIEPGRVSTLPFYKNVETIQIQKREKECYIYVSNGTPHKNHKNLIDAFCLFYDKQKTGTLILTVNDDYPIVQNMISEKIKKGYPLENIGFVDSKSLINYYKKAEFLIFPSFTESFGLGLIEAIECGCKVIGADLPYTYEVCEPSLSFNPFDKISILHAFEESLKPNIKNTRPKIKNKIEEIINIIIEKNAIDKK